MRSIAFVAAVAASVVGGNVAVAAVKPAHDVGVKVKLKDSKTFGPLARIAVRNEGTASQTGVVVEVRAEDRTGPVLWSQTVDILPRKTAKIDARIFLDEGPYVLVATATLAGATDEDPADNAARAAMWVTGRPASLLVGSGLYSAHCESCHGADAAGGSGPALVGAKAKPLLEKTRTGGDHDMPWFSKGDAKALSAYLKAPAAFAPPEVPVPPLGGWPGYVEGTKPLFDAKCVSCHPGFGIYDRAYASASRALLTVKKGKMPKGGANLTSGQIQLIQDWITGGRRP